MKKLILVIILLLVGCVSVPRDYCYPGKTMVIEVGKAPFQDYNVNSDGTEFKITCKQY